MESGNLGGGEGVSSGGSTTGSMSTVSKEDNLALLSSEVSSSYPDESKIELGLGLSLGCGGASAVKSKSGSWGGQGRILTAQDFHSSSSSSSSPTKPNNASCGTKRSANSFSPPRPGVRYNFLPKSFWLMTSSIFLSFADFGLFSICMIISFLIYAFYVDF